MPEITLVRQDDATLSESDLQAARRFIFGVADGLGPDDQRQWRRFWSGLLRLGPGEMVTVHTRQARLSDYHRMHMKLERRVFESQETFENERAFRDWLKVGAGHVVWQTAADGTLCAEPASTSYDAMEQGAMELFHTRVVEFLRSDRAARTLWPHLSRLQRVDAVTAILEEGA